MANASKTEDAKASPLVRCRVVTRYGGRSVGDMIDVPAQEYARLASKDADGNPLYPVLISPEHDQERIKREAAARAAEDLARRAVPDAADSIGWAAKQQESLDILNARALAEADRQEQKRKKLAEKGAEAAK